LPAPPDVLAREDDHMDRFLPLNSLHVVVVDDNVDARDMVTLALTKQRARVIATDSAPEARNIFGYVRPDAHSMDPPAPT
jgi:CheY-like chemotaxis protein